MGHWVRYEHAGRVGLGALVGGVIHVHEGDLFDSLTPTGDRLDLTDVTLLTPCVPGKMLALWNNFRVRAAAEGLSRPAHPLYFTKVNSSFLAHGQTVRRPPAYTGAVVFEAELGVVIGRRCKDVSEEEAAGCIFGYTCVNDLTAAGVLKADPTFVQWSRAKGFDGFGVFGPTIVTGIDPGPLVVRAVVNGVEKQNFPVSDMFYSPYQVVSLISQDMTLYPGDLISCGTSVGTEPMPPGSVVEVSITGVGTLINRFE